MEHNGKQGGHKVRKGKGKEKGRERCGTSASLAQGLNKEFRVPNLLNFFLNSSNVLISSVNISAN